jgi:hypothetical protein
MSIVDGSITAPSSMRAEAISTSSNVFLENVYFKGFSHAVQLVETGESVPLRCDDDGWSHVNELLVSQPSPPLVRVTIVSILSSDA